MRGLKKNKMELITENYSSEVSSPETSENRELATDMLKTIEALTSLCEDAQFDALSNIFRLAHNEASIIAYEGLLPAEVNALTEEDQWDNIEWKVTYRKDAD